MYAGLCALATLSREQLKTYVLSDPQAKHLIELQPKLKDAINAFVSFRYSQCLQRLDELKVSEA